MDNSAYIIIECCKHKEYDDRGPNPYQNDYDKCRFSFEIDYKKELNLNTLESYYMWTEYGPWIDNTIFNKNVYIKTENIIKKWGKADRENWCYDPCFGAICMQDKDCYIPLCLEHLKLISECIWKNAKYIPLTGLNVECRYKFNKCPWLTWNSDSK